MKWPYLSVLLLAACAQREVVPEIRTVEIKVPVPVMPQVPAELKTCGDDLPVPVFVPATDAAGAALIGLDRAETDKLLLLVTGLDGCGRAWKRWAQQ